MDEPKRKKKRRKEHFVCELDEFEKDRPLVTKTIAGRSVTCLSRSGWKGKEGERGVGLFFSNQKKTGEVHAFDSKCYHLGGSLENADIEGLTTKNKKRERGRKKKRTDPCPIRCRGEVMCCVSIS